MINDENDNEKCMIELKEGHYCFILDPNGDFVEIYMPQNDPDSYVPENVVKVVQLIRGVQNDIPSSNTTD